MANKPVVATMNCPFCGKANVVIWDGNRKQVCQHCEKKFKVRRQRLENVRTIKIVREQE